MTLQVSTAKTDASIYVPSPTSTAANLNATPRLHCSVNIRAEPTFSLEVSNTISCLQAKDMTAHQGDDVSGDHFFILFISEGFLKDKDSILPLISRLSDPQIKQRIFPIIMDRTLTSGNNSIFSAGSENRYVQHWNEQLKKLSPLDSNYEEVKSIAENIAVLIRAIKDTLIPSYDELAAKNFTPIIGAIEARTDLLSNYFFYLPSKRSTSLIKRDLLHQQLSKLFETKPSIVVSGEASVGKTTFAIEYAQQNANKYPGGIFWINGASKETLEEGFTRLGVCLGETPANVKNALSNLKKPFFLIYDNVEDPLMIPHFLHAQTLIIGTNLPKPDISLEGLIDEEAVDYVMQELEATNKEAKLLVDHFQNSPGKLADAVQYIKSSKISIPTYLDIHSNDPNRLSEKQKKADRVASSQGGPTSRTLRSFASIGGSSSSSSTQTVEDLAKILNSKGVQIFISYNWSAKDQVNLIDKTFQDLGIKLLRDASDLQNFASIKEFMKEVIRKADYTLTVINANYLRSLNCLFEMTTLMKDPKWKARIFPLVLEDAVLTDQAIQAAQQYWIGEAERLKVAGGKEEEVALAKDGAAKIIPFLEFVKLQLAISFEDHVKMRFGKMITLMLLKQEVLQKKGVYKGTEKAICYLPMGRNTDFTGRKTELSSLEEAFAEQPYNVVSLIGIGGVGKSQLALEYAYRHQDEYKMIYWLRSKHTETLKADLRMLGQQMGVRDDLLKDEIVFSTMKGLFEKRDGWLLIFDNAKDYNTLSEVIPQRGGHVLITSRNLNCNWPKSIPLDVFDKLDGLKVLETTSGVEGQRDQLALLAEELGYHPLALRQAGLYIKKEKIDVATCLAAFRKDQTNVMSQKENHYQGTIDTIWHMNEKKIEEVDPNAMGLLNFCGYLGTDDIPEELLKAYLKAEMQKDSIDLDFHEALRVLGSYGMITLRIEKKNGESKKWISTHRLIQKYIYNRGQGAADSKNFSLGLDVLKQQFNGSVKTKEAREKAQSLVLHVKSFLSHAEKIGLADDRIASLLNEIGDFYYYSGNFKEAREYYEKAKRLFGVLRGAVNHQDIADCYNRLSLAVKKQGDLSLAKYYVEEALKIQRLCFDNEDNIPISITYNNLGLIWHDMGKFEKAKEHFMTALRIKLACDANENRPDVAVVYNNLGLAQADLGDVEEARKSHQKAIDIKISYYKTEDHLSVATSYHNLATLLEQQGDNAQARSYYEKALKIRKECFGTENHLDIAIIYHKLGNHERALQIEEVCKGNYLDLAKKYEELSDPIMAQMMRIKHLIQQFGTENHVEVANAYYELVRRYKAMSELRVSRSAQVIVDYAEKALQILISLGTLKESEVAEKYIELAKLCTMYKTEWRFGEKTEKLGITYQIERALEFYERAVMILLSVYSTEVHPDIANLYGMIGDLYLHDCNFQGAIDFYEQVLQIYKDKNFKWEVNELSIAEIHIKLADAFNRNRKTNASKEHLDSAFKLLGKKFSLKMALLYEELGPKFDFLERFVEAIECYEKGLACYKQGLEINKNSAYRNPDDDLFIHSEIAECYQNLRDVHLKAGNKEASLKAGLAYEKLLKKINSKYLSPGSKLKQFFSEHSPFSKK